MADMSQMDPDLMGAAGLELAGEETGDRLAIAAVKGLAHFIMGDRSAAAVSHRHLLPGVRMAVDRGVDRAAGAARHAPGKGEIAAPHLASAAVIGELRRQRLVSAV